MTTHEGAVADIRNALQIAYAIKGCIVVRTIAGRADTNLQADLNRIRIRLVDALAAIEDVREHLADAPPEAFASDDDHAAFQLLATKL